MKPIRGTGSKSPQTIDSTSIKPRIAFVYDWLVNYNIGGGEKVLEALMELWPEAPIFTLVYDPTGPCGLLTNGKQVKPSLIQLLPGSKNHHRLFMPLMPFAIERFDLSEFEAFAAVLNKKPMVQSDEIQKTIEAA